MTPTVSITVTNYNGKHHLKEYFDSLFKQTRIPDEIFMYDNGSTDGSVDFVKKNFPGVRIISKVDVNTGPAVGQNIVFEKTIGKYVIIQANDLRLDKNCVNELVKTLNDNHEVGLCTSAALSYQKKKELGINEIEAAGGKLDVYGFSWPMYHGQKLQSIPKYGEIFCAYGNSFIIRREIFKKLSGFDEAYFALNDDIDLSWRVRLLGYSVVYNARSIVYHKSHATLGSRYSGAQMRYWSERNSLRTVLKNYSLWLLVRYLPGTILLLMAESGWCLWHRRPKRTLALLTAIGWNILHFPDTLAKRKQIQSLRKVNDDVLLAKMYGGSFKWDHRNWPKEW